MPNAVINQNRHLIIGAGQVGRSLYEVLQKFYSVSMIDKNSPQQSSFQVLHICYPFGKKFLEVTQEYLKTYRPLLVIIHATVPVGITEKVSPLAVHSPIRGMHPNLTAGIKTFVKYFGGPKADEASTYFSKIGIKTKCFREARTTELLKILDTTYYAWNIVFCKEVERICNQLGLSFHDVYEEANEDYNKGYQKLGNSKVTRPILTPIKGQIGGHCLIPNLSLLDDWLTKTIAKRNNQY